LLTVVHAGDQGLAPIRHAVALAIGLASIGGVMAAAWIIE
jgi:hypothetical protein